MDIEKSQRLVKFSNLIKDMVDYMEVSEYLLQCQVISQTDHDKLSRCVQERGNPFAMEDLIHLLGLRRGGFNGFIGALKKNDYIWLADQMDLQLKNSGGESIQSKGIFPTIANNLKRRKSSKSEQTSSDTIFTSYRQSMPIDLGTLRRISRNDSQEIPSSSMASKFLAFPAKFISASLDNLKLADDKDNQGFPSSAEAGGSSKLMESECYMDEDNRNCRKTMKNNCAIIYNIPEPNTAQLDAPSDIKIVSKIAEELKFPEEFLKGLKAVRIGRISKEKSGRPLKVKFKTSEARNTFISVLKTQTEALGSDSVLSHLDVVPYIRDIKCRLDEPKSKNRWYQKRFLTLKKAKPQK